MIAGVNNSYTPGGAVVWSDEVIDTVCNQKGYSVDNWNDEPNRSIYFKGRTFKLLSDGVTFINTSEYGSDTYENAKQFASSLGGKLASRSQVEEAIYRGFMNGSQATWIDETNKVEYSDKTVNARGNKKEVHEYFVVVNYKDLIHRREQLEEEVSGLWDERTRSHENALAQKVLANVKDECISKFHWVNKNDSLYASANGNYVAFYLDGHAFVQMKVDWNAGENSYYYGEEFPYFISSDTFGPEKRNNATYEANLYSSKYFKSGVTSSLPAREDYTKEILTTNKGGISVEQFYNARIPQVIDGRVESIEHSEWTSNYEYTMDFTKDNSKYYSDGAHNSTINESHCYRIVLGFENV